MVLIVIPVPTLALAKVKTGEPLKLTSLAPAATPDKAAVPDAEAVLVSSYVLSLPVKPVIVKTPSAVTSFVFRPVVS